MVNIADIKQYTYEDLEDIGFLLYVDARGLSGCK